MEHSTEKIHRTKIYSSVNLKKVKNEFINITRTQIKVQNIVTFPKDTSLLLSISIFFLSFSRNKYFSIFIAIICVHTSVCTLKTIIAFGFFFGADINVIIQHVFFYVLLLFINYKYQLFFFIAALYFIVSTYSNLCNLFLVDTCIIFNFWSITQSCHDYSAVRLLKQIRMNVSWTYTQKWTCYFTKYLDVQLW